ncbi:MAG: sulfite exporter TauE/SafE family protein [Candidatus Omnitrophota bacterium]
MNWELILQPILTGLSVGAFCLSYCFPFMGVVFGAEERSPKKNLLVLLEFLAGRLAGYLCFGLLVGYLGEKFDPRWLHLATDISFIVLSLVLFLYLLGLVREKGFCRIPLWMKDRSPALLGFFMGINLCPPFLLSVTYVFSQHSALYGMAYFALFFLTSSLYFLPMIFVGFASRAKEFRAVARTSGFLVAGIFFIYGIYSIVHNWR